MMEIIATIFMVLIFVIFIVLMFALLWANKYEEEYLNQYDWVKDEFKIPEDDEMEEECKDEQHN